MNRNDLEKMFDNENFYDTSYRSGEAEINFGDIKDFIFNTIIPEILKDILKDYGDYNDGCGCCANNSLNTDLIHKAKEKFNINL